MYGPITKTKVEKLKDALNDLIKENLNVEDTQEFIKNDVYKVEPILSLTKNPADSE